MPASISVRPDGPRPGRGEVGFRSAEFLCKPWDTSSVLVPSSVALVTTSKALVPSSVLVPSSKARSP